MLYFFLIAFHPSRAACKKITKCWNLCEKNDLFFMLKLPWRCFSNIKKWLSVDTPVGHLFMEKNNLFTYLIFHPWKTQKITVLETLRGKDLHENFLSVRKFMEVSLWRKETFWGCISPPTKIRILTKYGLSMGKKNDRENERILRSKKRLSMGLSNWRSLMGFFT